MEFGYLALQGIKFLSLFLKMAITIVIITNSVSIIADGNSGTTHVPLITMWLVLACVHYPQPTEFSLNHMEP